MLIPYLQIPSLPIIGSIAIHPFGVLVATGILVGAKLTLRRGLRLGLEDEMIRSMIFWSVSIGLLTSHVLDVLIYQSWDGAGTLIPTRFGFSLPKKLLDILDPRSGLSSMAGFGGAVFGLWLWCRKYKQEMLAYADSLAFGLAIGWLFGRTGCFVAHDHPGDRTSFFLGVDYPCANVPCQPDPSLGVFLTDPTYRRHDLGFYEVLVAGALSAFYFAVEHLRPRKGFYVAAIATYYGPVRLLLDQLRIRPGEGYHEADPRWLGLTPAQYACIVVTLLGIGLCFYVAKRRPIQYPLESTPTAPSPSSSSG